MKKRFCISLLMMILLLSLSTACDTKSDIAEDRVEDKLDAAEDRIEATLEATEETISGNNQLATDSTKTSEKITEEEAGNIALNHAGFTVEEVMGLRIEYEIDDGMPEYEIQFYNNNLEYEYTIHAESGEILSYDMDD